MNRSMSKLSTPGLLLPRLAGCCTCKVTEDIDSSVGILKENTLKLSRNYRALLDRAGPPLAPEGANLEDWPEEVRKWMAHVKHEKALMKANDQLADRVHTWTTTCLGGGEGEEDAADSD